MVLLIHIHREMKKIYHRIKKFYINNNLILQIMAKNLFLNLIYYIAGKNLKKKGSKCNNIKDFINLALNYKYSIFKRLPPIIFLGRQQKKSEILEFCKFIYKLKPRRILEIGTAKGGSLFLFSRISGKNSTIFSIDLPIIKYVGGITLAPPPKIFFKAFKLDDQKMAIIRGDSHDSSTLKKVKRILKKNKIDILFIDGNHSYKGVKKDFEIYSPLVRKNGIIAFHDIVEVPSESGVRVNKFWNEIKEYYEYLEFVEDWNQGRYGIGVIYKK